MPHRTSSTTTDPATTPTGDVERQNARPSAGAAEPERQPGAAHELIVSLARALHTGGAPAYELESRMEQVASTVGAPARFFSTPTSLFVTFESRDHLTRLIRVSPAETDLARLARLYELYRAIRTGRLEVPQALARLDEIEQTRDDYGAVLDVICYPVVGASAALFLGGNTTVAWAAGLIGMLVGLLVRGGQSLRLPGPLTSVVAGFVATVLACAVHVQFPTGSIDTTLLAALIVLLPGLQVTLSINELATQNLASGTARMAGAMTAFMTVIFGVVIGYDLADTLLELPPAAPLQRLDMRWTLAALVPVGLAFGVLFRARKRDFLPILLATALSFASVQAAGLFFSPLMASGIAALAIGGVSNLYARWTDQPVAVMLMPGLLLLVPGSLGFLGLSEIALNDNTPAGIGQIANMLLVAVSIVSGLLLSNLLVGTDPPESK